MEGNPRQAERVCLRRNAAWRERCVDREGFAGTLEGIDRLLRLVSERGAKAARLQVAGSFHSPLMVPAAARLAPALAAWSPLAPDPPFLSSTTCAIEPAARLQEVLLAQLTAPVRFGAAIEEALARGATRFVELGPGRVLSGLVKRVNREAVSVQIGIPADLTALVAS